MKELTRNMLCAVVLMAVVIGAPIASAQEDVLFDVTITNLTRGQIFSPPVVVTHNADVELFELGQPASEELAQVAEDGFNDPLVALLDSLDGVFDVNTALDVILPGQSMTVQILAGRDHRLVSVAGMMVITNDAFFAIQKEAMPARGTQQFFAFGYDSGSEANTEDCAHIPGPPCDQPFVRVTEGAEGFVHVHAGVHGGVSLDESAYDWRNPAALITVSRAE